MARGPQDVQGAVKGTHILETALFLLSSLGWRCSNEQTLLPLYPDVPTMWSQESLRREPFPPRQTLGQVSPLTPLAVCPEGPKGNTGRPRTSQASQTPL